MPPNAFEGCAEAASGEVAVAQADRYGHPVLDALFDASRKAEEALTTSSASAAGQMHPVTGGADTTAKNIRSTSISTKKNPSSMSHSTTTTRTRTGTTLHGLDENDDATASAAKVTTTCAELERLALEGCCSAGATTGATQPAGTGRRRRGGAARSTDYVGDMERENSENCGEEKMFVGGVPYDVTEAELVELLGVFAEVKSIHLIQDRGKWKHKGYGFVSFTSPAKAEDMHAMSKITLTDHAGTAFTIDVKSAARGVGKRSRSANTTTTTTANTATATTTTSTAEDQQPDDQGGECGNVEGADDEGITGEGAGEQHPSQPQPQPQEEEKEEKEEKEEEEAQEQQHEHEQQHETTPLADAASVDAAAAECAESVEAAECAESVEAGGEEAMGVAEMAAYEAATEAALQQQEYYAAATAAAAAAGYYLDEEGNPVYNAEGGGAQVVQDLAAESAAAYVAEQQRAAAAEGVEGVEGGCGAAGAAGGEQEEGAAAAAAANQEFDAASYMESYAAEYNKQMYYHMVYMQQMAYQTAYYDAQQHQQREQFEAMQLLQQKALNEVQMAEEQEQQLTTAPRPTPTESPAQPQNDELPDAPTHEHAKVAAAAAKKAAVDASGSARPRPNHLKLNERSIAAAAGGEPLKVRVPEHSVVDGDGPTSASSSLESSDDVDVGPTSAAASAYDASSSGCPTPALSSGYPTPGGSRKDGSPASVLPFQPFRRQGVDRRVFAGGLPIKMTQKVMVWFFSQWGDVDSARIIVNPRTGKTKRYGFVTFKERASAEALKARGCVHFVDGQLINVGDVLEPHAGDGGEWHPHTAEYRSFNTSPAGTFVGPHGDGDSGAHSSSGGSTWSRSSERSGRGLQADDVEVLALAAAKAALEVVSSTSSGESGVSGVAEVAAIAANAVQRERGMLLHKDDKDSTSTSRVVSRAPSGRSVGSRSTKSRLSDDGGIVNKKTSVAAAAASSSSEEEQCKGDDASDDAAALEQIRQQWGAATAANNSAAQCRRGGKKNDKKKNSILVFGSSSNKNMNIAKGNLRAPRSVSNHAAAAAHAHAHAHAAAAAAAAAAGGGGDETRSGTVTPMMSAPSSCVDIMSEGGDLSVECSNTSLPHTPIGGAKLVPGKVKQMLAGHRVVARSRQLKMNVLLPLTEQGGHQLRLIMERTATLISINPRTPRSSRMNVEVRGASFNVDAAWDDIYALCAGAHPSAAGHGGGSSSRTSSGGAGSTLSSHSFSACTDSTVEEYVDYFGMETASDSTRTSSSRSREGSDGGFDSHSHSHSNSAAASECASPTGHVGGGVHGMLSSRTAPSRSRSTRSMRCDDGSDQSSSHLGGAGLASNPCRVTIGGLSPETDTEELHDFFSLFGIVTDAGVCDEAGSDYGFVEFSDADTAAVVNKQRNLIFNNQIIEVRKPETNKYITYTSKGSPPRRGGGGKGGAKNNNNNKASQGVAEAKANRPSSVKLEKAASFFSG